MSMVYDSGDLPGDVLSRTAAVLTFLAETLTEGRSAGQDLTLSDEAMTGFALIAQSLARDIRLAAIAT